MKVAQARQARPLRFWEMLEQPLVISISPSKQLEIAGGKILNIGESEVMITKNIAIMLPTDKTLVIHSSIISENVFV